ncbi:MAG TPA: serine/threonine-protein kinase [Lacipirellulaceae bacterium]|nr:serine/threonine-protein kinase [Lacipirellulaceae bacterium]
MNANESHSSSAGEPSQGASSLAAEPPWDLIAERIDAFAAAWEAALSADASPPALPEFIADLDEAQARPVLVELVKLDIEHRWQHRRDPQHVEWYVERLPALRPIARLPVDLIYEELQARMLGGQQVYQEEVRERFPVQAEGLLQLLGGLAVSGSPTATYFADTVPDARQKARPVAPDRAAAFAHLQPGDRLDDFQLLALLGSGAFARVFLARQLSMERMVALKVSGHAGSEPQTLAQLDHAHIVRVYDQRQTIDPPARLLYMEVVPGGTLQDVIARMRHAYDGQATGDLLLAAVDERLGAAGQPIPESSSSRDWIADASWPEGVCRLGAELADGLAYAHSRGVMHRDIKPANVLLSAEARPKLADFNVSYNGGRADENPEDTFGGSLAYMSPEQLEACHPLLGGSPRSVREPSDVYALGVLLWELLCGRRPFRDEPAAAEGGSLVRLQRMIETRRSADFDRLAEQLPQDCPDSLRRVLIAALQGEKSKRIQSADELARALRLCLNPRCWQLLQEPRGALGRFVLRRPVLAVVLAGLIPNILMAGFNLAHNLTHIKREFPHLFDRFMVVQWWINALAFSTGIAAGVWMTLRTYRLLASRDPRDAMAGSTRALLFGGFVSLLLLSLWVPAGLAFPVAVGWGQLGGHALDFYLQFILSLALCGCAATAYPYFLITAMSVHYYVPALVRNGAIPGPRRADLDRVAWLNSIHFLAAAAVPLLGGLLLTLPMVLIEGEQPRQAWPLLVVLGGGLVGLGGVMALRRLIDVDMAALDHIAVDEARRGRSRASSYGRSSHDTSGRPRTSRRR